MLKCSMIHYIKCNSGITTFFGNHTYVIIFKKQGKRYTASWLFLPRREDTLLESILVKGSNILVFFCIFGSVMGT